MGTNAGYLPEVASLLPATRRWCAISVTSVSDEDLSLVIESELTSQFIYMSWDADTYPAPIQQALYRRVGRVCAAKGIPLGLAGLDNEMGIARIPSFDAEIDRLESPYRLIPVA